jgi:hypothetical protein
MKDSPKELKTSFCVEIRLSAEAENPSLSLSVKSVVYLPLPPISTRLFNEQALAPILADQYGSDDDRAFDDQLRIGAYTEQVQSIVQDGNDQHSEEGPIRSPYSSRKRRAAHHDGSKRIQEKILSQGWPGGAQPSYSQHATETGDQSG